MKNSRQQNHYGNPNNGRPGSLGWPEAMKLMSWNCQGLGNPRIVRALRKLIANNKPDIIFLMETKLHNLPPNFKNQFAATYSFFSVDCTLNGDKGKSGGLILLWNNCTCQINIKDMNFNYIDMGDLNLIIKDSEKYGGNPLENNITMLFRSTLNSCDLQDLGYKGNIYTWENKQQSHNLIKARLDRFLANSAWKTLFPNYCNSHLLRYKSDHAPILLDFNSISVGPRYKAISHQGRSYLVACGAGAFTKFWLNT
ncbi:unnamed protein product [Trifolium pratense]|uniref:Uncharacterized protein n=1 Tax=Trifolium pratense TaxID=57577 RepID=A0ACB0JNL1_TRIPR|nr:unnamed protein product [Trifolium pratense]